MLSNEIKCLKMKKIKFENLGKKNPEIRHLPTNHPLMQIRCLNVHYESLLSWKETKGLIISLCWHVIQRNGIYDMTNNLKIIISLRGGNLLFVECLVKSLCRNNEYRTAVSTLPSSCLCCSFSLQPFILYLSFAPFLLMISFLYNNSCWHIFDFPHHCIYCCGFLFHLITCVYLIHIIMIITSPFVSPDQQVPTTTRFLRVSCLFCWNLFCVSHFALHLLCVSHFVSHLLGVSHLVSHLSLVWVILLQISFGASHFILHVLDVSHFVSHLCVSSFVTLLVGDSICFTSLAGAFICFTSLVVISFFFPPLWWLRFFVFVFVFVCFVFVFLFLFCFFVFCFTSLVIDFFCFISLVGDFFCLTSVSGGWFPLFYLSGGWNFFHE